MNWTTRARGGKGVKDRERGRKDVWRGREGGVCALYCAQTLTPSPGAEREGRKGRGPRGKRLIVRKVERKEWDQGEKR